MRNFLSILFLFVCFSSWAQAQDRSLAIRFLDPSCKSSPVKGVKVKVEGSKFSKYFKTDAAGWLRASKLKEGRYKLTAIKYGFKRMIIQFIELKGTTITFEHSYNLERGYASDDANAGDPKYEPCKHPDLKPSIFMHVP